MLKNYDYINKLNHQGVTYVQTILYLSLISLSLIWGASFLFIKVLLDYYNPFGIVFFRALFGAVTILIIMLVLKKPIIQKGTSWLMIFIIGLINSFIPWTLFGISETLISSSMASILNATTPIWTLIIGILLFKSKSSSMQWLGIIVGFLGIFILLDIDFTQLSIDSTYGFLAAMLAPLFYGISSHMTRKYLNNLTNYQTSLYVLIVTAFASAIPLLFTDSFNWSYLYTEPKALLSLVGLGGFGSGIAFIIYFYLIKKSSPEFASLATYLIPISALFWGLVILSEELHSSMLLGLTLILLGVYISSRRKKQLELPEQKSIVES